jgi:hypothetical protein
MGRTTGREEGVRSRGIWDGSTRAIHIHGCEDEGHAVTLDDEELDVGRRCVRMERRTGGEDGRGMRVGGKSSVLSGGRSVQL